MKTADPELMRAINRFHVIDTIRREAPIARVEIADRTELSRATVSAITGALIEDGLVNAVHVGSADTGARGRPRVLLELNGAAYHVAGVMLSVDRICVAITDFKGSVLAEQVHQAELSRHSPGRIADLIAEAITACAAAAGREVADVSAIGIGLPGMIDGPAGLCHWSPVLGPSPVAFAGLVAMRTGIRTVIETQANLIALAEHWFGHGRGLRSFAVLTITDTLGLGLMTEGRLYRGAGGIGMAFGHMKLTADGPLCGCGQRGCLDITASEAGLVAQALACDAVDAGMAAAPALEALTARALAGEHPAAALFHRAGEGLGRGIANLINLLSPPRLIICGDARRMDALRQGGLLPAIKTATLPLLRDSTEIVFHSWTDAMLAQGAASIVLRQIDEQPWSSPSGI